ncbi:MAG: type III pantothenate kinase [Steroidobacteraceae bacterium]
MKILLIDAGNTRIKWSVVTAGKLAVPRAAAWSDTRPFADWLARAGEIERVVVCSVAGAKGERVLRSLLHAAGAPPPEFVHSSAEAAGVRNAYRSPRRLGDDRWVGAVSAWHLAGCFRAICAISVGTALTIDVVDCDGVHRGGLIAPGPTLMLQSLLRDTAGIAPRAAASAAARRVSADATGTLGVLATDTGPAIELGCLFAAAALVDRTITDVTRRMKGRPVVFLTGGGAAAVAPLLRSACKQRDDLVLRGIALLAGIPVRRRG